MTTTTCLTHPARWLAVALLGSLGACGGGSGTSAPVPAPVVEVKAGTWVVMGSSTAAGTGAPAGKGWVAQLAAAYAARGVQVANIAKGASLTYEGLSTNAVAVAGRPAPDPAVNIDQALARKPVLLIVSYPSNDTAHSYSVDETVNNLLAIRAQALAAGVPVVVTSTQPRNLTDSQLAQMRTIDQKLAASVGGCFVAIRQALAGPDGRLAPGYDSGGGVHPNEAWHVVIATQVGNLLNQETCIRLPKN
jgi:hypothetical protein